MATYKVIQNVEAEDKILGPLTLRQFIYAGAAAISFYLTYLVATHDAAFMAAVFLPAGLIGTFFAIPWGRDQPTEVWALARIRYMLKPRRRIWNQSGVKELVTVTAPKTTENNYTNGLSETEVKSRLHALADTLDSRGWAIKNSAVNLYSQPALVMNEPNQDRLLDIGDMPQQAEPIDIHEADDMLDEQNNPAAQQMDTMIAASAKAHRQKIVDSLNAPEPEQKAAPAPQAPANDYWFLNGPGQGTRIPDNMVTFNTQVVTPHADGEPGAANAPNEQELVEELDARKRELPMTAYYGHLHTIQPLSAQQQAQKRQSQQSASNNTNNTTPIDYTRPSENVTGTMSTLVNRRDDTAYATPTPLPAAPPVRQQPTYGVEIAGAPKNQPSQPTAQPSEPADQPVTPAQQAAILQLAHNDDLNVATLAREAQRSEAADGEVVIKLH